MMLAKEHGNEGAPRFVDGVEDNDKSCTHSHHHVQYLVIEMKHIMNLLFLWNVKTTRPKNIKVKGSKEGRGKEDVLTSDSCPDPDEDDVKCEVAQVPNSCPPTPQHNITTSKYVKNTFIFLWYVEEPL